MNNDVTSGTSALDCLTQIESDQLTYCCVVYLDDQIPTTCSYLKIENSLYDGVYSLSETQQNSRHVWTLESAFFLHIFMTNTCDILV